MKKNLFTIALAFSVICFPAISTFTQTKSTTTKKTDKLKVVKEGVGFDGIRVGRSTSDDVIKKFGKPSKTVKHKKYSVQLVYPGGMSFYYCQADKRKQIFDIELRAPFRAKTSKGVVLSESTLEDVYKIYGKSKDGLEYRGISFFYAKVRGKNVITVIDIVENTGIRQCD